MNSRLNWEEKIKSAYYEPVREVRRKCREFADEFINHSTINPLMDNPGGPPRRSDDYPGLELFISGKMLRGRRLQDGKICVLCATAKCNSAPRPMELHCEECSQNNKINSLTIRASPTTSYSNYYTPQPSSSSSVPTNRANSKTEGSGKQTVAKLKEVYANLIKNMITK